MAHANQKNIEREHNNICHCTRHPPAADVPHLCCFLAGTVAASNKLLDGLLACFVLGRGRKVHTIRFGWEPGNNCACTQLLLDRDRQCHSSWSQANSVAHAITQQLVYRTYEPIQHGLGEQQVGTHIQLAAMLRHPKALPEKPTRAHSPPLPQHPGQPPLQSRYSHNPMPWPPCHVFLTRSSSSTEQDPVSCSWEQSAVRVPSTRQLV